MSVPDHDMTAIIGGSGFSELACQLADVDEVVLDTPYGRPSGPITTGRLGSRRVAFLPRHGREHDHVAHRVPYRANVWALHQLGVRAILAPCTVGSLQPDIHPGQMVVIDQLVDRTHGRPDTYHDVGGPLDEPGARGAVHHQGFADPYDPALREQLVEAARRCDVDVVDGGTMVVINGPRFSTRAESRWFRQMGWHVVNMTGYPESVLAAELGIRYASIALVTDHDAGVDGVAPVTMEQVFEVMRDNVSRVQRVLTNALAVPGDSTPRVP